MIGIKRRRKVEGWALEVSDTNADAGRFTVWHRLADNTRLWFVALAAVVLISAFFVFQAVNSGNDSDSYGKRLAIPPADAYKDAKHKQFAQEFATSKAYGGSILSAEFVGSEFKLILSGTTSADEIDYTAKMAAKLIEHKFKHRAIVVVYMKRASDGKERFVANTKWDPKRYGYTIKFRGSANKVL